MSLQGYNLRTALLIFVLLPLLALSAAAGWYSLKVLEKQSRERMQDEIELVARAIRQPVTYAMERDREGALVQALDSTSHISRVYSAYVYDASGNRIGASGPTEPAVGSRRVAELMSEGHRREEYNRILNGEDVYSYFLPLSNDAGQITGMLQITRRASEFESYIARLRYQGLAVLLVTAVLLSVVIFFGHYKAFGSHVAAMRRVIGRIGAGEREQRVPTEGPRELHDLAVGLNRMLENLNSQEAMVVRQKLEQAALEDRLHRSERMAAIGQLAAGVAHELGTPLNVVDGQAQRALRHRDLNPAIDAALSEIRQEVQRMNFIVRQLMDFGRSNPLQYQPERADRIVRAVLTQVASDARYRHIAVQVDETRPIPELMIDRLRMEQALSNLLHNAVQAATHQVRIGWFANPTEAGFVIDDDGPGIAETDRERIFEPFYTSKGVDVGTGLGLAVAHAAVRDHDGQIEIQTSPLGGARFRIVLQVTLQHGVMHE
ncbi:MAG: ATP-binding protein [Pseudomonadota bacterium]|nr:ATP-binding protein [Pseudomonadota bacterium]